MRVTLLKSAWILTLALLPLAAGTKPLDSAEATQEAIEALNVNTRYTVDAVHVSGVKMLHLSQPLRSDLDQVVGAKLDHPVLDRLAERIKKELRVPDVKVKVTKGATSDHVTVDFEIQHSHRQDFDLNVARLLYNSRLGWTGEGAATTHFGANAVQFGLVSDVDSEPGRFAGLHAGFIREKVGTDRLNVRFDFASYHEQWSSASLSAAAHDPAAVLDRSRQSFSPMATLVLAEPLEWSFGSEFARFRPAAGYVADAGTFAKTESSNAVVSTLRYHRRWSSGPDQDKDEYKHDLRASYSFRAATHVLASDAVFVRHWGEARYSLGTRYGTVEVGFAAGAISGNAPVFERFSAGNSVILRGWNKYDLDPLGTSHLVHGSVDYTVHHFLMFYDTGAVWDRPVEREQKQSVGVGIKAKDGFQLALAFPVRGGRAEPVFYAGVNF